MTHLRSRYELALWTSLSLALLGCASQDGGPAGTDGHEDRDGASDHQLAVHDCEVRLFANESEPGKPDRLEAYRDCLVSANTAAAPLIDKLVSPDLGARPTGQVFDDFSRAGDEWLCATLALRLPAADRSADLVACSARHAKALATLIDGYVEFFPGNERTGFEHDTDVFPECHEAFAVSVNESGLTGEAADALHSCLMKSALELAFRDVVAKAVTQGTTEAEARRLVVAMFRELEVAGQDACTNVVGASGADDEVAKLADTSCRLDAASMTAALVVELATR